MKKNLNALILGISSGFGKATALELARNGYNIYGVHLDRGPNKLKAEELRKEIENMGVKVTFFNFNAADDENRQIVIDTIKEDFEKDKNAVMRVFLHSLAFGSIGPLFSDNKEDEMNRKRIEMTQNVMANSLVYWTQDLFHANLLHENCRIFAMTSNGSSKVMNNYGAVGAAKAALEAYVRHIAVELGPHKVTANAILAGFTDTPASRVIPGFDENLKATIKINPQNRNTTPEDVAGIITLLADERAGWISGQVLGVDGGESLIAFSH